MPVRCLAILLLALAGPALASDTYPETDAQVIADYEALTSGVSLIDVGDGPAPGVLVVHGREALPLVLDEGGQVFVGAGRLGAGRVVAFTHTTYFGAGTLRGPSDVGQLVVNSVTWGSARPRPVVGVQAGLDGLRDYLADAGFDARDATPADLATLDVFCVNASAGYSVAELDGVRAWVEAGGAVLTAGTPWAFSAEDFAVNYPGNRMTCGSGVTFNGSYTWPSAGRDAVPPEAPCPLGNATRAVDALTDHVTGVRPLVLDDQVLASRSVMAGMGVLDARCSVFFDALEQLMAQLGPVFPTLADPVVLAEEPLDALRVRYDDWLNQTLPADQLTAHPAADDFPGAVPPGAPRVERTLTLDGTHAGLRPQRLYANPRAAAWRSTGLYAAPGELVEVVVPPELVGAGLGVLIGCHSDTLFNKESWTRSPRLTRSYPLDAELTPAANSFGGLVFVTVPVDSTLGTFEVTVRGGVVVPRYLHGETTLDEWRGVLRDAPAPWAEVGSDRFVMSVPSSEIRDLDDPASLMTTWDAILDADADLAAMDRQRARAERFVLDRQISVGWMHAGYPLMAHDVSAPGLLDESLIRSEGSWGPLHELGHDHQWRDWVIPHTTESSVNLWSVYASEDVLGISRDVAHGALAPATRRQRLVDYVAAGAIYDDWGAWHGLEFYLQLQEGFGWQPYTDVFAEYIGLDDAERPTDDQQRIDQWLERFSRTVDRNLAPFFDCWGVPTTAPARDAVAGLPTWEEDPMREFCDASPAALHVNRAPALGAAGAVPAVGTTFDAACAVAPHRLCAEEVVPGALDGMTLIGEASARGRPALWLYQHSGGTDVMTVRRAGGDLVFALP